MERKESCEGAGINCWAKGKILKHLDAYSAVVH